MFDYTQNNHYKFGYENHHNWFTLKESSTDKWKVEYGKSKYLASNWRDECIKTAELIYNSTDLLINILFSGGIDSEVVVQSFMELGVPFKATILKLNNDWNLHDISFAITYCEQNNINYDLINLDVMKFWDTDICDYASNSQCILPGRLAQMWSIDQIDGLPIIGGGECYLVKRVPENYISGKSPYENSLWDIYEKETLASWYMHFINQERPAIPGFFRYTPELMYAFLIDPIMQELVNNKRPGKLSTITTKFEIYSNYFKLAYREKYTGFEQLHEHCVIHNIKLRELYGNHSSIYKIEYSDVLKALYMKDE